VIATALLGAALGALPPVPQAEPPAPAGAGRAPYLQYCASCHGADARGGPNAPSLRGVGAADVDFMLTTGRMPAAVPWLEIGHRGAQFPQATIDALVAYVAGLQPGGPPIPVVVAGGDVDRGRTLFRENCMHCHGVSAGGAAIGGRQWAPSLNRATVIQVAEAIRVGPAEMPKFGERQLDQRDVDDIATYLSSLRAQERGAALPLAGSGPVPEGLLGWISAGVMAAGAYAFSAGKRAHR
jgi:ubiquinol-cytochrome c reductase cytochrome c subunit